MEYILHVISNDFQETGECRMQIAKEGFMNFMASFALTKGSRYTNFISRGYGYRTIRTIRTIEFFFLITSGLNYSVNYVFVIVHVE